MRPLVLDGSAMFRAGLRRLVESDGLRVAGEGATFDEAVELLSELNPRLVLLDVFLPGGGGVELCRRILAEHETTAVVMISPFDWDILLAGSWSAGASGFLLKNESPDDIRHAVRAAQYQQLFTSQQIRRVNSWTRSVGGRLLTLAPRERHVLRLVARGLSNRDIAENLLLSENTVEKHVGALLKKLGSGSRTGLLAFILQHHLEVIDEQTQSGDQVDEQQWWIPAMAAAPTARGTEAE